MSALDSQQIRLKLTTEKLVLNELKRKRALKMIEIDGKAVEAYQVQFDSKTFTFKKDTVITVGKAVAESLERDALVIVGPAIDGEVYPVLERVGVVDLEQGEILSTPTTCPFCHEEQNTPKQLVKHIIAEHDDDVAEGVDGNEEPIVPPVKPEKPVQPAKPAKPKDNESEHGS